MTAKKTESLNIHQRLVAVRSGIAGIGKDSKNKFQNFEYVSHSKVMGRVRQLMDKHGISLTSSIKNIAYETYQDKKGARQVLVELETVYTFTNVDDPSDTVVCEWYSQGTDAGERCVGKALSYSNKYFLLSQFLIPTDRDDPDASDLPDTPAQPVDPKKQPMSAKQKKELQDESKALFGEKEYRDAVRDIATNICNFPPQTVEDYELLMAEFKQINSVKKAAKETFSG